MQLLAAGCRAGPLRVWADQPYSSGMSTPVIGITLDREEPGGYSKFPWLALRENYCRAVNRCGASTSTRAIAGMIIPIASASGSPARSAGSPPPSARRWAASRIEPVIGHLKAEHRMDRNYLKGFEGDRANAVLAAGYNFRLLLRALAGAALACPDPAHPVLPTQSRSPSQPSKRLNLPPQRVLHERLLLLPQTRWRAPAPPPRRL